MKARPFLPLICVALLLAACQDLGPNSADSSFPDALLGAWSESFLWDGGPEGTLSRTTTLTISKSQYTVVIRPSRRTFTVIDSQVTVVNAADTLFAGQCYVKDGVLFLQFGDKSEDYDFRATPDSLQLSAHPNRNGEDAFSIRLRSLVWAWSYLKEGGVLARMH